MELQIISGFFAAILNRMISYDLLIRSLTCMCCCLIFYKNTLWLVFIIFIGTLMALIIL